MKRIFQLIWRLTGTKLWRVFSLLIFLGFSGLAFLIVGSELTLQRPSDSQFLSADTTATVSKVSILVRFLPDYDIEYLPDRTVRKSLKYGRGVVEATTDKVALVLVDCWEYVNRPREPSGHYKNIAALLEKARAHGITIIHAPNHPVVDKYSTYHALHREVDSFLRLDFPQKVVLCVLDLLMIRHKEINKWPPAGFCREVYQMRQEARTLHYMGEPPSERKIAHFLRPREGEFVVESSEEFRYVLWLRKINLLLYVGGATNECILHRPTGVLNLVGSNYVIVLLGDCTAPSPSPWCDNEVVQKVFEDYYMRSIGYVANSKEIIW